LCRGPDDDDDDGGVVWVVLEDAFHSYPVKNSHLRTRPTSEDHEAKSLGGTGVPGIGIGTGIGVEVGTGAGDCTLFLTLAPHPRCCCCWWRIKFQELAGKKGQRGGAQVNARNLADSWRKIMKIMSDTSCCLLKVFVYPG